MNACVDCLSGRMRIPWELEATAAALLLGFIHSECSGLLSLGQDADPLEAAEVCRKFGKVGLGRCFATPFPL